MSPSAKVIADSISPEGARLTTIEVTMHRFVLAEFNTHRLFSRNSASSRAIPVSKQTQRVKEHPAIPVVWASEQKGMQGGDEVEDPRSAEYFWLAARDWAVIQAENLTRVGVHKSIVNRLLEPFMWHTVIVTSTDWENFWKQRVSPLAQPEIKVAAEAMLDAYKNSTPTRVSLYQWHLPYMDEQDLEACRQCGEDPRYVSAARCARVSYLTHDGRRDVQEDVDLYRRLISADPMHASPLEHVATPRTTLGDFTGNFFGWKQLRHEVQGSPRRGE